MNQIDLHQRHAVITGGAQGIGLSVSTRLLASGATVCIWDKDLTAINAALEQLGNPYTVSTQLVDVTDTASVIKATESTIARNGKIDILVASAGIAGPNHMLWEYPADAWKLVIDINLTGVFHCCRAIIPHMLEKNYGRIVNIASIAGKEGNPQASAYSASKAGVRGWKLCLYHCGVKLGSTCGTLRAVLYAFTDGVCKKQLKLVKLQSLFQCQR